MSFTCHLQKAAALAGATFTAVLAIAFLGFFLRFLGDEAASGVPFGGHTVPLGGDYVWANRLAVLFVVSLTVLLAHALVRIFQQIRRWRAQT